MKRIRLHGELGKKFGREFMLEVTSAAEAIRALMAVVPGFQDYLYETHGVAYRVWVGTTAIGSEEIQYPCSDREVIRIAPIVQGAGGGGLGTFILGAALVVASGGMAAALLGTEFASTMAITTAMADGIAAGVGYLGMSMVLGGVAQMLSPSPPSSGANNGVTNTPGYAFSGVVNTVAQGNPVPVCYGELVVGSQVISAGISTT